MTVYPSTTARRPGRQPLSAEYIRTVRLKTTGVLGRSYDPVDVDRLLDRVATDIEARNDRDAERDAEIERLREDQDARRYGRLPNAIKDEIPADAVDAQRAAQRYSDKIIASAQQGATQITKAARTQAEQILVHAAERADKAAFGYRQRVPAGAYSADREEVERMLAVLDWVLDSFQTQFGAYHEATKKQLKKVRDRLDPDVPDELLEEPAMSG